MICFGGPCGAHTEEVDNEGQQASYEEAATAQDNELVCTQHSQITLNNSGEEETAQTV